MSLITFKRAVGNLEAKSLLGNIHPLPRDNDSLDLRSSLVDLVNLGISHQFLHWVLGIESVPTEYLYSVSGGLISNVSGETLKYQDIRYYRP